ncbi:Pyrimidine-specific ribonucleoside hydrolase RihB [Paenibacillus sp. P1XP2]|nr:Pyrimidine-specific ribonucleoside hydrolase RihB [Paenibacillus sp. P1XP2]
MKKAILDVDTGIDDALGIMLAIRSGELDVLGITTVNGNVSLETATTNTCKILELIHAAPSIAVYPGASRPLMRDRLFEHRSMAGTGLAGHWPICALPIASTGACSVPISSSNRPGVFRGK